MRHTHRDRPLVTAPDVCSHAVPKALCSEAPQVEPNAGRQASPARACSARPTAPSLKAVTAHRMTTSPVCGYRSLLGPIVQPQSWYLLEVTPIPGDQHHVLYQRRGRNAEIATAHTQPHGP